MTDLFKGMEQYRQRTSLFPHSALTPVEEAFIQAKMELQKCTPSPLTAEKIEQINRTDRAICEFLRQMDRALKRSRESTLHFVTTHSQKHSIPDKSHILS